LSVLDEKEDPMPTTTVPPVTADQAKAGSWRKTITGLTDDKGGQAIQGAWLAAGDTVALDLNTVVIAVDKTFVRFEAGYRTGDNYPVYSADVTLYVATDDGLEQRWARAFKNYSSAIGATTRKQIAALLDKHAPTGAQPAVVAEAQRRNTRTAPCRWCRADVPSGLGHLVGHGDGTVVEHWQQCPARHVDAGTPCVLCGVTVIAGGLPAEAERVLRRDGSGVWETRHVASLDCTTNRVESYEEYQDRHRVRLAAEAAERDAARAKKEKAEAAAAARKAKKLADAKSAHDAEQARIAGLTETGRSEKSLFDKALSTHGRRVRLSEINVQLSDGTSTLRWSVSTYSGGSGWTGEDGDPEPDDSTEYTQVDMARKAYQGYQYVKDTPTRGTTVVPSETCDECGYSEARHPRFDSSGIPGKVCNRCNVHEDFMLSFA
jgi:hypothetical protein